MDLSLVFSGCHTRGGVERSVYEAARHLRDQHRVTVYASEFADSGLDGVALVHVPPPPAGPQRPLVFARNARQALAGSRHDHVISFGVGSVGADVLWVNSVHRAWLEAARALPWSGWKHPALRYALPRHQVLLAMERQYFRRTPASLVVVVADRVGQDLTRLYGVPPERLQTIHNGYAPAEFSPERARRLRAAARGRYGFADDEVVLVMAANELERKGFVVTLDALERLGDQRLRLLLVGRADPAAILDARRAAGHRDAVVWPGSVDMSEALAASDAFVLPTQYEAFCLAIVEALAAGLPVLSSTAPGAGDLIRDGVNGVLVEDPTSVAEVAGALGRLADDRGRADLATHAAASVADLAWPTLFERAAALLQDLPVRPPTAPLVT